LLKEILIVTLAFLSQLAQAQQIKSVEIQGLKRTQVEIVYREIGYTEGDSVLYSDSMRAIWEQRLQATKLFNRVQVQKLRGDTLPVGIIGFSPRGALRIAIFTTGGRISLSIAYGLGVVLILTMSLVSKRWFPSNLWLDSIKRGDWV
jgi:hypothetical protein